MNIFGFYQVVAHFLCVRVWWKIHFGWWWVVVDIFWLVVSGGRWWWVVVDIFWPVMGGGGHILAGGGWWWVVVGRGGWWHSLVSPKYFGKSKMKSDTESWNLSLTTLFSQHKFQFNFLCSVKPLLRTRHANRNFFCKNIFINF